MPTNTNLLKSDDCFATVITAVAIRDLGWESLQWLPETILMSLERRYGELPLTTINKLFAGFTLLTTDFYWMKPEVFHIINGVLWDGIVDDTLSDIDEICWGLTEASLIFPNENGLCPALKVYCVLAAYQAGLLRAPKILERAGVSFDLTSYVFEDIQSSKEVMNILEEKRELAETLDEMVVSRMALLTKQLRELDLTVPEELKVFENLGINT